MQLCKAVGIVGRHPREECVEAVARGVDCLGEHDWLFGSDIRNLVYAILHTVEPDGIVTAYSLHTDLHLNNIARFQNAIIVERNQLCLRLDGDECTLHISSKRLSSLQLWSICAMAVNLHYAACHLDVVA